MKRVKAFVIAFIWGHALACITCVYAMDKYEQVAAVASDGVGVDEEDKEVGETDACAVALGQGQSSEGERDERERCEQTSLLAVVPPAGDLSEANRLLFQAVRNVDYDEDTAAELVRAALDSGAQVNVRDKEGDTPLVRALTCAVAFAIKERANRSKNQTCVKQVFSSGKVIQALLDGKADVTMAGSDGKGFTPLMWSTVAGNPAISYALFDSNPHCGDIVHDEDIPFSSRGGLREALQLKYGLLNVDGPFVVAPLYQRRALKVMTKYTRPGMRSTIEEFERCWISLRLLYEQDWLPEQLLAFNFLGVKALEQLVCDYACHRFDDERKKKLFKQQIEYHRRGHLSIPQRLALNVKDAGWGIVEWGADLKNKVQTSVYDHMDVAGMAMADVCCAEYPDCVCQR